MSTDDPKTTVTQMRYVQANRELITDPAVIEEFDRLAAFMLGSMQGIGQRQVERDLDLGQDREPTFEFPRPPLDPDGFQFTINAAREGAYAASIAAGLTTGQATAAADAAEAALRAREVVKTTAQPPYPGLGPDPGDPVVFTLPPQETTLIVPFSLVVATDAFGSPGGSVAIIPAGHGDLTVMEIAAVYTVRTSAAFLHEEVIGSGGFPQLDLVDGSPNYAAVAPFYRDVLVTGDWSWNYRDRAPTAPDGGIVMTPGDGVTLSCLGGSLETWELTGTITIIVSGYVP